MDTVYILMGMKSAYAEKSSSDILAVYQTMELAQEAYQEWKRAASGYDDFYIHAWQVRDRTESPCDYYHNKNSF